MYATSLGGAPAWPYWGCDWDPFIFAGVPLKVFTLKALNIHGMGKDSMKCKITVVKLRFTRSGCICRLDFVACFLRDFCERNKGHCVDLTRIGAGETVPALELG